MVTPEAMGEVSKELERQLSGGCAEASCIAELAEPGAVYPGTAHVTN